jgi:hypothetical protein
MTYPGISLLPAVGILLTLAFGVLRPWRDRILGDLRSKCRVAVAVLKDSPPVDSERCRRLRRKWHLIERLSFVALLAVWFLLLMCIAPMLVASTASCFWRVWQVLAGLALAPAIVAITALLVLERPYFEELEQTIEPED